MAHGLQYYIYMITKQIIKKGNQKMNNKLAKVIVKLRMVGEYDLANKIKKDHLENNLNDKAIEAIELARQILN